jgi:hypothetical protein
MHSDTIQHFIDILNQNKFDDLIFKRPLTDLVDIAKVWPKIPEMEDSIIGNFKSYTFFFIKNTENEYVGAVLDMGEDLHWYVNPKHRQKSHLSNALRFAILPYVLEEKDVQRISIDKNSIDDKDYQSSRNLALSVGFKPVPSDEKYYEITYVDLDLDMIILNTKGPKSTEERIEIMKKKIWYAYQLLYQVSDELKMTFDSDKGLIAQAYAIREYTSKIEDLNFDHSENH